MNRSELDELSLSRARRGDRKARAALIECYGARVHALVARMLVGDPAAADDVCQDALVKVILGLSRFDPVGPARLSTWILTVATRVCIDHLRRPRIGTSAPEELTAPDDPERTAARHELARRVERAMSDLAPEQRAVLILRAYHDLDYDEIARALGIEVGTVKSRLSRARGALRRAVRESRVS